MTFIPEDGTGLENANALISVEFSDDYFALRGIEWSGIEEEKQQRIVQATDYIELRFGHRIDGEKKNENQALSFPLKDFDSVPKRVMEACAEYAYRAAQGVLMPDPVQDESGMTVAQRSEKIGPISETITYRENARPSPFKKFPYPDSLMVPFLRPFNRGVIR